MSKIAPNISTLVYLTAAWWQPAIGQPMESDTLVIDADTPVVETGFRAAGRNFMRLPDVRFTVSLDTHCSSGFLPQAMSLSVADTRKSLTSDDISADAVTVTEFTVPASQVGPVAVNDFCVAIADADDQALSPASAEDPDEGDTLVITSVISIQASLLCANEAERRMTYASRGLDVSLACRNSEEADTAGNATTN
jgi:hypothetical protein